MEQPSAQLKLAISGACRARRINRLQNPQKPTRPQIVMTDSAMARYATSDDASESAMRRLARYLRIRGANGMDRDTLANELDWKLDPYRYSAGMYRT